MTKDTVIKPYGILNAAIAGLVSGVVALMIGYLIHEESIKHQFDLFFPYAATGLVLSISNFKVLSKISILVLPPVYAFSGFGLVAGALLMGYLGWEKSSVNSSLALVVENVPFFLFSTILYSWYSSLAGKKSFLIYAAFATITVVVSMLIFGDKYEAWLVQGVYLGGGAFLFSLLHLK